MYSNGYKCPFCGTVYYKVDDVVECIAKCVEKEKKKEAASEELDKLRQEKYNKLTSDLAAQKEELNKLYNSLKAAADKYNEIANKISKIDGKTKSFCSTSISFDSEKSVTRSKRMDKANSKIKMPLPPPAPFMIPPISLAELIDEVFDF